MEEGRAEGEVEKGAGRRKTGNGGGEKGELYFDWYIRVAKKNRSSCGFIKQKQKKYLKGEYLL